VTAQGSMRAAFFWLQVAAGLALAATLAVLFREVVR
jgi:hypothetical protein